jgi:hypothetical protein
LEPTLVLMAFPGKMVFQRYACPTPGQSNA